MARVTLSLASLKIVKREILSQYPNLGSSHVSEALAVSAGYRTHAALTASLKAALGSQTITLVDGLFIWRLKALGYERPAGWLGILSIVEAVSGKTNVESVRDWLQHYASETITQHYLVNVGDDVFKMDGIEKYRPPENEAVAYQPPPQPIEP